jgi:RNA polymerase sigma factor (sigma-70 family)
VTGVDDAAFRELFDAHLADVWRYARRRCATSADADDVAGETFAVAWRRRAALPPGEGDARLWLLGTARRVLANQRRSQNRQHRLRTRATGMAAPSVVPVQAEAGEGGELWQALSRPCSRARVPSSPSQLAALRPRGGCGRAGRRRLCGPATPGHSGRRQPPVERR